MDVLKFAPGTKFTGKASERGHHFEVISRNDKDRYYNVRVWNGTYLAVRKLKFRFDFLVACERNIILYNDNIEF